MKRLLLAAMMLTGIAVTASAEIKFENLAWFTWDQTMDSNSTKLVDNNGAFYMPRFYVTLQGDLGKDPLGNGVKGRFTLDFAKAQFDSTTNTTKSIPIKYAYFDYAFLSFLGLSKEVVFSAGQLKSYFGNIADWSYPIPVKDATETYSKIKPSASADFGVMLSGTVAGMVKYYFQLLNGEGYEKLFKETSSQSDNFTGQFSAFLTPLSGLSVGGSYRMSDSVNSKTETSIAGVLGVKNLTLGEGESAMVIPCDVMVQYITHTSGAWQSTNTTTGTVVSAMAGYTLLDVLTPYVRYDMVDENTSSTNAATKYSYLYAGLNFSPIKNLAFKPFFSMNLNNSTMNVKVEMEYKLNFSIWQ